MEYFEKISDFKENMERLYTENMYVRLRNKLHYDEMAELCHSLIDKDCNVETLVLKGIVITDEHVEMLCHMLKYNTSIRVLNLKYNPITDIGAKLLADALKVNKGLTSIKVSFSNTTEEGDMAIVRSLWSNYRINNVLMKKMRQEDFMTTLFYDPKKKS